MQIYVHISGKNYGPYSIDQLREYVSKGSFKSDSQACYDGKNWVTVSDIPGFVKDAEKPKQQTVPAQQKPKKKINNTKIKNKMTKIQANIIIILLMALLGFPFFGFLKPSTKWEYSVESPMDAFFISSMNGYGKDGWELVSARRASGPLGPSYECILKRKK